MNWSEFFNMGGYGLYVWGSYGMAALVLVFNVLAARRREKSVRRELEETTRLNQAEAESE
jgi:heme exporter protein D